MHCRSRKTIVGGGDHDRAAAAAATARPPRHSSSSSSSGGNTSVIPRNEQCLTGLVGYFLGLSRGEPTINTSPEI